MKVNRAAIRYSKASLDYAVDKNIANIIEKDFKDILLTISDSNDLRDFFRIFCCLLRIAELITYAFLFLKPALYALTATLTLILFPT